MNSEAVTIPMKYLATGAMFAYPTLAAVTPGAAAADPTPFSVWEICGSALAGVVGAWMFREPAGFKADREAAFVIICGACMAAPGGPTFSRLLSATDYAKDWLAPGQVIVAMAIGLTIGLFSTTILGCARLLSAFVLNAFRNPVQAADQIVSIVKRLRGIWK